MSQKIMKTAIFVFMFLIVCSVSVTANQDLAPVTAEQDAVSVSADQEDASLPEETEMPADTEEEWPTTFTDVSESAWYYDSVKFVTERHIAAGVGNDMFAPETTLTRGMLVTFIYRYAGSAEPTATANFSDIDSNAYYYKALCWAVEKGIAAGRPDGTFLPNVPIQRQDVAAMLHRFAVFQGDATTGWLDLYDFSDGGSVSSYAKNSMQWAYSYKVMSGKGNGTIDPSGKATRAECAKLIHYFDGANFSGLPTAAPSVFNGDHVVTYDAMCGYLNTLQSIYPALISVSDAGNSEEGRALKLVKIGTGSNYIYMQGNIHAREYLSLNYLLEVLDSYAYAYTTNTAFDGYSVRGLLSNYTIVMIPCVNPDGENIAVNGYGAAQNPSSVAAMYNPTGSYVNWKANARGTDLNRNFPSKAWKLGSVKRPANAEYAGTAPGSAAETKAVVQVLKSYPFKVALDCHTAGNLLYYADNDCSAAYRMKAKGLASAMSAVSGYGIAESTNGGGAANYFRHNLGIPGITVELYPSVSYPLNSKIFTSAVWSKAKDFPLTTIEYLQKH